MVLFLLVVVAGLALYVVGGRSGRGDVICPGENSPQGAFGEEVPGPMRPGDTSCSVTGTGEIRTYEQQKDVQERWAGYKRRIGAALISVGCAGALWVSRPAPRPRG